MVVPLKQPVFEVEPPESDSNEQRKQEHLQPDGTYLFPGNSKPTNYETALSPQDEQSFQKWKTTYAPHDSGMDYDLRGAFKEGLTPDPQTGHWPDTYKKPNHPTFSVESKYAKDAPDLAGSWQGDKYIPPKKATSTAPKFEVEHPDGSSYEIEPPAPSNPSFLDQAKLFPEAVKTVVPHIVKDALEAKIPYEKTLVTGEEAAASLGGTTRESLLKKYPNLYGIPAGITEAGAGLLEGVYNTQSLGLIAATAAIPSRLVQLLAGGGFSGMMAKQALDHWNAGVDAYKNGDHYGAAKNFTSALGTGIFSAAGMAGALNEHPDISGGPVPPPDVPPGGPGGPKKQIGYEPPPPPGSPGSVVVPPPPAPTPGRPLLEGPPNIDADARNMIQKISGKTPEQIHADTMAQENAMKGVETGVSHADLPSPELTQALKSKYGDTPEFSIPGREPAIGVERLGLAAKKLSTMLGLTPSNVTEAMIDARNAYQDALDQGMQPEEAQGRSNVAFWKRVPVKFALNNLGIGSDNLEAMNAFADKLKSGDIGASKQMMDSMMKADSALSAAFPEMKAPEVVPQPYPELPKKQGGQTLGQFVRQMGGFSLTRNPDLHGEIKSLGDMTLTNNKTGRTASDILESAIEAGFLPPGSTTKELFDALGEEKLGRPKYSQQDVAALEMQRPIEHFTDQQLKDEITGWQRKINEEGLGKKEQRHFSKLIYEVLRRTEQKLPPEKSQDELDYEKFANDVDEMASGGTKLPDTEDVKALRKYGVPDSLTRKLVFTDTLTGLRNRKYIEEMGHHEKGHILFDIDKFKFINDTFGHRIGDAALKMVAKIAADHGLENNIGRLGGDEFIAWMDPKEDPYEFAQRFKEFQDSLARAEVGQDGETVFKGIKTSAGFGTHIGVKNGFPGSDEWMYQAKAEGGDKLIVDKPQVIKYLKDEGLFDESKQDQLAGYTYERGDQAPAPRQDGTLSDRGVSGRRTDLQRGPESLGQEAKPEQPQQEPPLNPPKFEVEPPEKEWPSDAGAVLNPVEFGSRLTEAIKQSKTYEEFKKLVESDKDLSDTVRFMSTNLQEAYDRNKKPFYSGLIRDINEKMPSRASVPQIKAILKDMSPEEVQWSGIDDFIKDKGIVAKSDLMGFLRQNQVEVKEVVKGDQELTPQEEKRWLELESMRQRGHLDSGELNAEFLDLENRGTGKGTKFQNYQLPGGTNYRELLLTLPPSGKSLEQRALDTFGTPLKELSADQKAELAQTTPEGKSQIFSSSHFDEPNILAHVRFNDRVDARGRKGLFIEEAQSDWHQKGRDTGYQAENQENIRHDLGRRIDAIETKATNIIHGHAIPVLRGSPNMEKSTAKLELAAPGLIQEYTSLVEKVNNLPSSLAVPDAPFKKNWHELAMKRMLRYAVENGYEWMGWTTGEQQAERYDLSKEINSIQWMPGQNEGIKNVRIEPKNHGLIRFSVDNHGVIGKDFSSSFADSEYAGKQLSDVVGKDIAKKIMESGEDTISGSGLKVGGEGMKGFYDQMIPSFLNKYSKKWGGKTDETKINIAPEKNKDYYIKKSGGEFDIFDVRDPAGEPVAGGFKTYSEAKEYAQNDFAKYNQVHSLDITPSMKQSITEKGQPFYGMRGQTLLLTEAAGRIADIAKKATDYADFRKKIAEDADLNDTVRFYSMNLRKAYDDSQKKPGIPESVQKIMGVGPKPQTYIDNSFLKFNIADKLDKSGIDKTGEDVRQEYTGALNKQKANITYLKEDIKTLVPDQTQREALTLYRDSKETADLFSKPQAQVLGEALQNKNPVISQYKDIIEQAMHPTPEMLKADKILSDYYGEAGKIGQEHGFLSNLVDDERYINRIYKPVAPDNMPKTEVGRSGLGKSTGHAQPRYYQTLFDAMAKGRDPATLDAADLVGIHGEEFARTLTNNKMYEALGRSGLSYKVDQNIPIAPGWTKLGTSNVAVPKWLELGIRAITDPNYLNRLEGYKGVRQAQGLVKTIDLGISLFHHFTLVRQLLNQNEYGLGLPSLYKFSRMADYRTIESDFLRHGGETSTLDSNAEVMKQLSQGDGTLGKAMVLPGIKQVFALIDKNNKFLFGQMQPYMKVMDYGKKVSEWIADNPKATDAEIVQAKRGFSKQENAAFGGINWKALGVSPTGLGLGRLATLAADWSFSKAQLAYLAATKWRGIEGETAGTSARAHLVSGVIGGYLMTYLMNQMLTGKPPSENPKGHKFEIQLRPGVYTSMFTGILGDVIGLAGRVSEQGAFVGTSRFAQGKLSPFVRTAIGLMTNSNYSGGAIAKKNESMAGNTWNAAKYIARSAGPVPFGIGAFAEKESKSNTFDPISDLIILSGLGHFAAPPRGPNPFAKPKALGGYKFKMSDIRKAR